MEADAHFAGPTKRRVRRACVHCRAAKTCCSDERPCFRCVGLKLECKEAPPTQRKGRKRSDKRQDGDKNKITPSKTRTSKKAKISDNLQISTCTSEEQQQQKTEIARLLAETERLRAEKEQLVMLVKALGGIDAAREKQEQPSLEESLRELSDTRYEDIVGDHRDDNAQSKGQKRPRSPSFLDSVLQAGQTGRWLPSKSFYHHSLLANPNNLGQSLWDLRRNGALLEYNTIFSMNAPMDQFMGVGGRVVGRCCDLFPLEYLSKCASVVTTLGSGGIARVEMLQLWKPPTMSALETPIPAYSVCLVLFERDILTMLEVPSKILMLTDFSANGGSSGVRGFFEPLHIAFRDDQDRHVESPQNQFSPFYDANQTSPPRSNGQTPTTDALNINEESSFSLQAAGDVENSFLQQPSNSIHLLPVQPPSLVPFDTTDSSSMTSPNSLIEGDLEEFIRQEIDDELGSPSSSLLGSSPPTFKVRRTSTPNVVTMPPELSFDASSITSRGPTVRGEWID